MASALADDVKEVRLSHRLTESAAVLVGDPGDLTPTLEKMYRAMGQEPPKVKRILELNPHHALVTGLRGAHDGPAGRPGAGRHGAAAARHGAAGGGRRAGGARGVRGDPVAAAGEGARLTPPATATGRRVRPRLARGVEDDDGCRAHEQADDGCGPDGLVEHQRCPQGGGGRCQVEHGAGARRTVAGGDEVVQPVASDAGHDRPCRGGPELYGRRGCQISCGGGVGGEEPRTEDGLDGEGLHQRCRPARGRRPPLLQQGAHGQGQHRRQRQNQCRDADTGAQVPGGGQRDAGGPQRQPGDVAGSDAAGPPATPPLRAPAPAAGRRRERTCRPEPLRPPPRRLPPGTGTGTAGPVRPDVSTPVGPDDCLPSAATGAGRRR